jgi:hypothetical protein
MSAANSQFCPRHELAAMASAISKTMAQMIIKPPAAMKQAIKVTSSTEGVPLKEIAQDAPKLYFNCADDTLMTCGALVVGVFEEIAKKVNVQRESPPLPKV